MPKLREKVAERLHSIDKEYAEAEGRRGQLEGEKTRLRLRQQNEQLKQAKKR